MELGNVSMTCTVVLFRCDIQLLTISVISARIELIELRSTFDLGIEDNGVWGQVKSEYSVTI